MKKLFILLVFYVCCIQLRGQQYLITTYAGSGISGYTGSGGPATAATLYGSNATLYYDNATKRLYLGTACGIRYVDSLGIIWNFAGGGTACGYSGDGGPASAALMHGPGGITGDAAGNLYFSDAFNEVIRKIDTAGIITAFAGDHSTGFSGDNGPATNAALNMGGPGGLACDHHGNLYVADQNNNRVRKIDAAGIITTCAGTGVYAMGSGDGGPATAAVLPLPVCVAVDTQGNLYVSENYDSRIRKIDTSGIISTYAGTVSGVYYGDGIPATLAILNTPYGVAVNNSGKLFICDVGTTDDRVRMVDAAGIIHSIAGNGTFGFRDDLCAATAAEFYRPGNITIDNRGYLYVSDFTNNRIRRIRPDFIPVFSGGHTQNISLCINAPADSINSILGVNDTDGGQGETWTAVISPAHGTLSASYAAVCPGGHMVPGGIYYRPAPGYAGTDSFSISVTDCANGSDTTTVYVTIDSARPPTAGIISGHDTLCLGKGPVILTDTVTGGAWHSSNSHASLSGSAVTGLTSGKDTIFYTVSNACGTDTASFPVSIVICPDRISNVEQIGEDLVIFPNPSSGTFSFLLTTPSNEEVHISITNPIGEKVKEVITATNTITEMRLNAPGGIYFVNAVTAHGAWSERVVVSGR